MKSEYGQDCIDENVSIPSAKIVRIYQINKIIDRKMKKNLSKLARYCRNDYICNHNL